MDAGLCSIVSVCIGGSTDDPVNCRSTGQNESKIARTST